MKYKWNNPSGNIVTLKISKNAWYKKYNLNGFVNLNKYKNNIKILHKIKKNNNNITKKKKYMINNIIINKQKLRHKKILLIFIAIIIIFFLYIQ